ncbi:cell wall-binding repeat-containing protein [Sutcliffiella cohnii]
MKKQHVTVIIIVALFFYVFAPSVFASEMEGKARIIVKYKEEKYALSYHIPKTHKNVEIKHVDKKDKQAVIRKLERDEDIDYIEEDPFYPYNKTVSDSLFNNQSNDFQVMSVIEAWQKYQPKKQAVVAILDSGIDDKHPDLINIIKPYNILVPDSYPKDDNGHGTHVAGIVGAATNNKEGIASIARNIIIIPVKVGNEWGVFGSDLAKGIYYAVDQGADIINISIAGFAKSRFVEEAVQYANAHNVLVVAAAGNESTSTSMYPAALPGVLSVGAINPITKRYATFSNFGPSVSVAAPGVDVMSTFPTYLPSAIKGYSRMSGTSMASPYVASTAALLKSHAPTLTAVQLKNIIEDSSNLHGNTKIINVNNAIDYFNKYNRISGKTSIETSVEIAKAGWDKIEETELTRIGEYEKTSSIKGKFAILTSNATFPDALAITVLAHQLQSPILLSNPKVMDEKTIAQLREMEATHVILAGGLQALNSSVEEKLRSEGFGTIRLRGNTRYDTAVEVASYVDTSAIEVIIANGKNFPDALSVSKYAAQKGIPILFVDENQIPSATKQFLEKRTTSSFYIIGGTGVISSSVERELSSYGSTKRLSGKNRYETNIDISRHFSTNSEGYYFATGVDFKDALSGGLLAARENKELILIQPNNIPTTTKNYLQANKSEFRVLGGSVAINPSIVWEIDSLINR